MKLYKKANGTEDQFVLELSRDELIEDVARHWVTELMRERVYYNFLLNSYDYAIEMDILDRINALEDALGDAALQQIVHDIEQEFGTREPRLWNLYLKSSEEEHKAVREEVWTHGQHGTCRCPLPNKVRKDGTICNDTWQQHITDWEWIEEETRLHHEGRCRIAERRCVSTIQLADTNRSAGSHERGGG
jgi:hypothetical protein